MKRLCKFSYFLGFVPSPSTITTWDPDDYPSGGLLKDRGSSTTTLGVQPIRVLPWRLIEPVNNLYRSYPDDYPSGSLLKDGDSPTMTARCQHISGLHPDSHPSESTAYIGSYPDGDLRGVSWKMEARPQLLAQRPITLVLMMINSCGYSLLIILYLNSFSDWPRY